MTYPGVHQKYEGVVKVGVLNFGLRRIEDGVGYIYLDRVHGT